jgi:hypothetical protein
MSLFAARHHRRHRRAWLSSNLRIRAVASQMGRELSADGAVVTRRPLSRQDSLTRIAMTI